MLEALRHRIDGGERITAVRPLTAGHSNQTYLLEGLDRVLQAEPRGPALMRTYDVARLHAIYTGVGRQAGGPPVPAVFDLVADTSVIGTRFLVMERCRGDSTEWHPPAWMQEGGAPRQDRVCQQWIGAVAELHALPASTVGDAARTPADQAVHWLEAARWAAAPRRLLDLLDHLATDPPGVSGPPACVHGDAKLANFLWDEGELVALLDWEMAHVGDPLYDLGYMLSLMPLPGQAGFPPYMALPGWWTREQVIDEWERRTGRSAEDVGRYELLGMATIAALFARGVQMFQTGESAGPRLERWQRTLPWYLDAIDARARATGTPVPA